ncbi:MAG: MurR/RpiR family transcriptional regulator [Eubacteriaceae bacterium]
MNLNQLVSEQYENFSDVDHNIWHYVCIHNKECCKLSIGELAKACHVSPTAISRFCKKLGLDGFGELKMALKWQNDDGIVSENILNRTYQDYFLTLDYLKRVDLTKVFELINRSGRIFTYGTGEVQKHAARELRRIFITLQKTVFVIDSKAELFLISEILKEEDTLIIFSMSGNNPQINDSVREVRKKGVGVIAITSYEDNILASLSDAHLYYYNHCVMRGKTSKTDAHLGSPFFMINEVLFIRYLEKFGSP